MRYFSIILALVFHRILDFTRGWISIRPFCFSPFVVLRCCFASSTGAKGNNGKRKKGQFCHCPALRLRLVLQQKLIDSKNNPIPKERPPDYYPWIPSGKFLYPLKSKVSRKSPALIRISQLLLFTPPPVPVLQSCSFENKKKRRHPVEQGKPKLPTLPELIDPSKKRDFSFFQLFFGFLPTYLVSPAYITVKSSQPVLFFSKSFEKTTIQLPVKPFFVPYQYVLINPLSKTKTKALLQILWKKWIPYEGYSPFRQLY
jgi:hypothetical protein